VKVKGWLTKAAAAPRCRARPIDQVLNQQSGHNNPPGAAGIDNLSSYAREVWDTRPGWSDHVATLTSGTERKMVAFERATAKDRQAPGSSWKKAGKSSSSPKDNTAHKARSRPVELYCNVKFGNIVESEAGR
jgi:hypothetical protein